MDLADFTDRAPGSVVRIEDEGGGWAFQPNPLPTALTLDAPTQQLLEEARGALGELSGVGRNLTNPYLLVRPFMRREAISSSRIEGTVTTMEELSLYEARPTDEPSETQEVANYVAALEYGLGRLAEPEPFPISLRLFREVHERLLAGVRGGEHRPGEFRVRQNKVGQPGEPLANARYVPPPVPFMTKAMEDLEQHYHAHTDLPALVKLALHHYQFEAIHPFEDGNGRMGRLLVPMQMVAQGLLRSPLLYLSAYVEQYRDEYLNRLLAVSQQGDWLGWVRFFLTGILEQSRDAVDRSEGILALHQQYREQLQTAGASALPLRIIDLLFDVPAATTSGIQSYMDVTPRTAQFNIDKLVAAGILEEVTGQARNRIYLARGIIRAANSPAAGGEAA